jgi:hypothetical protein
MMQLGVHFANFAVGPRPGGPGETLAETVIPVPSDPVGFVARLGETIVPRLAQIPAH